MMEKKLNRVNDNHFKYLESTLLKVRYDVAASLINPKRGIIEIGPQGENRIKNWFPNINVHEFTEEKNNFDDWKKLINVEEWDCLVWLGVSIRPKYKPVEHSFELIDSMNEVIIEGWLTASRQEYMTIRNFILDNNSFNNVEEIKWDFIENDEILDSHTLLNRSLIHAWK